MKHRPFLRHISVPSVKYSFPTRRFSQIRLSGTQIGSNVLKGLSSVSRQSEQSPHWHWLLLLLDLNIFLLLCIFRLKRTRRNPNKTVIRRNVFELFSFSFMQDIGPFKGFRSYRGDTCRVLVLQIKCVFVNCAFNPYCCCG